jgi:hypothetical protein
MQAVWPDTTVEESNLTYHVFAIRKALGENGDSGPYIETVPKRGYRFVAAVRRVEGDATSAATGHRVERRAAPGGSIDPRRRGVGGGIALVGIAALGACSFRCWPSALAACPCGTGSLPGAVTGRLAESGMFSVSPDGRRLVFATEGPDGILRLWMRTLSVLQPVPLPAPRCSPIVPPAVWSPDSGSSRTTRLGHEEGRRRRRNAAVRLRAAADRRGWQLERRGDLLLGNAGGGLLRCPRGRPRDQRDDAGPSGVEQHILPSFLSDGGASSI